ncbi:hypothetical protein GW17_00047601 [Ensete ventricosum]|nr:hypothetical protein GW17_00047601 [Ensete ventricosum]
MNNITVRDAETIFTTLFKDLRLMTNLTIGSTEPRAQAHFLQDTNAKEEEEKPKSDPKKMTQIFGNRAISPLRSLPGMSELRRCPWASGSDLTKPTPRASHKEPRQ